MRRVRSLWALLACGCTFSVPALDPFDAAIAPGADLSTVTAPDLAPSCNDGVRNGGESDIDCGGACGPCSDGRKCGEPADCASARCAGGVCVPPCNVSSQCPADQYCVKGYCTGIAMGLVAWWKLDEASYANDCVAATVMDASGNGHLGGACPAGAGPIPNLAGRVGEAAGFDGTERHVDVAASPAFNFGVGDFSLTAWVQLADLNVTQAVWDGLPECCGHSWLLHRPGVGWVYEVRPDNGANTVVVAQTGVTTAVGVWTHVALVRSADTWTIYVNGMPAATATLSITIPDSLGPTLGWGRDDFIPMKGTLDEVRVYARALGSDEVRAFSN